MCTGEESSESNKCNALRLEGALCVGTAKSRVCSDGQSGHTGSYPRRPSRLQSE